MEYCEAEVVGDSGAALIASRLGFGRACAHSVRAVALLVGVAPASSVLVFVVWRATRRPPGQIVCKAAECQKQCLCLAALLSCAQQWQAVVGELWPCPKWKVWECYLYNYSCAPCVCACMRCKEARTSVPGLQPHCFCCCVSTAAIYGHDARWARLQLGESRTALTLLSLRWSRTSLSLVTDACQPSSPMQNRQAAPAQSACCHVLASRSVLGVPP
jgi:hypothetical protein